MAKDNFNFIGDLIDEVDSTWNYGMGSAKGEKEEKEFNSARQSYMMKAMLNNEEFMAKIKRVGDKYTEFKLSLVQKGYETGEELSERQYTLQCEAKLSELLKGEEF
jgi:phage regulator Rha-like protein